MRNAIRKNKNTNGTNRASASGCAARAMACGGNARGNQSKRFFAPSYRGKSYPSVANRKRKKTAAKASGIKKGPAVKLGTFLSSVCPRRGSAEGSELKSSPKLFRKSNPTNTSAGLLTRRCVKRLRSRTGSDNSVNTPSNPKNQTLKNSKRSQISERRQTRSFFCARLSRPNRSALRRDHLAQKATGPALGRVCRWHPNTRKFQFIGPCEAKCTNFRGVSTKVGVTVRWMQVESDFLH